MTPPAGCQRSVGLVLVSNHHAAVQELFQQAQTRCHRRHLRRELGAGSVMRSSVSKGIWDRSNPLTPVTLVAANDSCALLISLMGRCGPGGSH